MFSDVFNPGRGGRMTETRNAPKHRPRATALPGGLAAPAGEWWHYCNGHLFFLFIRTCVLKFVITWGPFDSFFDKHTKYLPECEGWLVCLCYAVILQEEEEKPQCYPESQEDCVKVSLTQKVSVGSHTQYLEPYVGFAGFLAECNSL